MWKEQQINVPVNCFTPGIATILKVLVPCKSCSNYLVFIKKKKMKISSFYKAHGSVPRGQCACLWFSDSQLSLLPGCHAVVPVCLGPCGTGTSEDLWAQRWLLAPNKTPTGPSCKEGIYNNLKYSSSETEFGSSSHFWAPLMSFASWFPKPENFQGILKVNLNWECFKIHHLEKVPHCWYRSFVLHVGRSWLLRLVKCWSKSVSSENLETVPLVCPLIFLRDMHVYSVKFSATSRREERNHLVIRKFLLPPGCNCVPWKLMVRHFSHSYSI